MTTEAKPKTKRLYFYCWECKRLSYMDISANIDGSGKISCKCPNGHIVTAPMNQNEKPVGVKSAT
jgi:hypothetical protein